MNEIELRIPADMAAELLKVVFAGGPVEPLAFGLASSARVGHRNLLLVRKIIRLPTSAYLPSAGHGARWSPRFTLAILNQGLKERLGLVIFHAHPVPGGVRLSPDDVTSGRELLARFQCVIPERPHASVVFGLDRADGMVLMPGAEDTVPLTKVRCLGEVIEDYAGQSSGSTKQADFAPELHRQVLAIGSRGQSLLRNAVVAVVGLGGGGSHVVQQLAHMGLGEVIGIDGDRADRTNRSRLIGLRWWDVVIRRRKTFVMKRLVREINGRVKFTAIPYEVPSRPALDAIKRSDIVVGCLDNLHARADLQDLAWRYLIPYIDVGVGIQLNEDGDSSNGADSPLKSIGGNVHTFIPGDFCARCTGFITQEKLDAETGGRGRSYLEGVPEAQVVSFNGLVASQAASEVLQLLVGYAPGPRPRFKKFDGFQGTLRDWQVKKDPNCKTCLSQLAAGDMLWTPI